MDHNSIIECGGFYFIHNFDSGNLGHVERVPTELIAPSINSKNNVSETPDYEFNLWTRPDCAGTEFENGNRTWFYFGVQASEPNALVRLNLINLNKQGKMYNQGMAPVTRTLPGKPQWERIRDRPIHSMDDNTFTLSFKYRTCENLKATTFFAFTYPFSFAELQIALNSIDLKMLPLPSPVTPDDIYYYRECLIYSLEGRRVDLLTITSHHGLTSEREDRLKNLFPDNQERPFKFQNKKVIFVSARVHPGETPSSFVFNGFLNLLLTRHDPIAIQLRKYYVFKMIPFLNPDGVARGHYRTDTRGVNLNRVYLNPSLTHHPTVYASRALIRYYHFGCEKEDNFDDSKSLLSRSIQNISENSEVLDSKKKKSQSTPYKGNSRTKKPLATKSTTTIKQPSNDSKKQSKSSSGETSHLAEQVYDMNLREMPSQTSDRSSKSNCNAEPSLLNDSLLRTCLGSNVHISTSEELNLQGGNPLRPLRDTLKNSISLLMETSSSIAGDSEPAAAKESRLSNVRMGWCSECRQAVSKLEHTMPGITSLVPGYSQAMGRSDTYHSSIDEYREHQKQQLDERERYLQEQSAAVEKGGVVYFCTNCFKKYYLSEKDEEIKIAESTQSTTSVAISALSGGARERSDPDCTGDAQAPGDVTNRDIQQPGKAEKPTNAVRAKKKPVSPSPVRRNNNTVNEYKEPESGLYLYIDLHGHASKKGIFMYGNHFDDLESSVECMLLPRIMSLNNLHFHFSSCNFTERNMYLKDRRDGMSREGSGRVAVLKATGLVRSYTLECNYNTGRLVNVLPPALRDGPAPAPAQGQVPPKYTPHIFEEVKHCRARIVEVYEEISPMEVGRSLGASILDLTGQHPNSRIPCSEHRNLAAVRDWLRAHTRTMRPQLTMSRLRPKTASPTRVPLYARSKAKVTDERKENTYLGAKIDDRKRPLGRGSSELVRRGKTREPEPKPKMAAKRRSVLAIRKPNASKTQLSGVVKAKVSTRRSADDAESSRASLVSTKLNKRSFSRARNITSNRCRAMASSSSEELVSGAWEEVAGGTQLSTDLLGSKRRPLAAAPPEHLKKIRLKTGL